MCVWGGGGWDRGGGAEAVQAAQRGQEIQPISVSLFSVGGGDRGGDRGCPSCSREDKIYSLYL